MTYLKINLKTIGLSVNLRPVVLRHVKGYRKILSKVSLKIIVNVM